MAEDKGYAVYARGDDGKIKKLATFEDAGDARAFELTKKRFGAETRVLSAGADAKRVKAAFPKRVQEPPVNSALQARMASVRGQVQEEEFVAAARASVSGSAKESATEAVETAEAAEEEAAKEADKQEQPA